MNCGTTTTSTFISTNSDNHQTDENTSQIKNNEKTLILGAGFARTGTTSLNKEGS